MEIGICVLWELWESLCQARMFWSIQTTLMIWYGSFKSHLSHISRLSHYSDVIMGAMASQITSPPIVYLTVYSGADQRKHQSSASLAIMWGIHRWPVNSPHKWPVTRKMFPFDDVILCKGVNNAWTSLHLNQFSATYCHIHPLRLHIHSSSCLKNLTQVRWL